MNNNENNPKVIDLVTIEDLMQLTVAAESFEGLAQKIVDKCAELLHADLCTLWRRIKEEGQDKLILGASKGFKRKPGEIPQYILNWDAKDDKKIKGVTAWIVIRKKPCIFNSYSELSLHPSHKGYWDKIQWDARASDKFKSLIGIPLFTPQKEVVGVLKWENSDNPEGFSKEDFELAKKLTPFIAIALESMNVRENHEKHRQEVLRELTVSLLKPFEEWELYQQIVNTTASLLNSDLCSMWLCDSDRKELKLAAAFGVKSKAGKTPVYKLNWNAKSDEDIKGLTAWVVIRGKSYYARYYKDLIKHPSHRGIWDEAQWDGKPEINFSSFYAVPLISNDKVFGVLKIERKNPKPPFSDVDKAVFDVMAEFIVLALELGSRLRQDVVFDFFHLLKQPASNCLMAFSDLREELKRKEVMRPDRIEKRLNQLARNLESIRGWTYNVYALATAKVPGEEEKSRKVKLQIIINNVIQELKFAFPDFKYDMSPDVKLYSIHLTPLEEKKIQVILFNILDNSIKFSGDNPVIKISIIRNQKNELELTLKDNGQGIAEAELPYIFDPYFTRGVNKWPESLGLGLTTVSNLLEEFHFDKKVESKPNMGTAFTIFIPQKRWEM